MKKLKEKCLKISPYIGKGFLLCFCVALFLNFLAYNGSVGEKLFLLVMTVALIWILAADFHDDIIKWLKKKFED